MTPGAPIDGINSVGVGTNSALEPGYYSMRLESFSGSSLVGTSEDMTDQQVGDRGSINIIDDIYTLELTNR
jgi:hypothetical protein